MLSSITRQIDAVRRLLHGGKDGTKQLEQLQVLVGRLSAEMNAQKPAVDDFSAIEFRVFSQFGEDGIIQHLLSNVRIADHTFVELGVEDYQESNTRFLMMNNNWRGMVVDSNPANIEAIKGQPYFWRHDLQPLCSFITRESVNQLIAEHFSGPLGILSIDLDGVDYWVLDVIDVVQPAILICEFNSLFGGELAVTVPYQADFSRSNAHYSHLYWGASLEALRRAALRKGLSLVGCNSGGNNAFFVRTDMLGALSVKTSQEAFVEAKFRESRDESGQFNFLRGPQRLEAIKDCQVVHLDDDQLKSIGQLYGIS